MSARIAVIDHGAGNLVSIIRGLERGGAETVTITDGTSGMDGCDGVVLPGVGATGAAMTRLHDAGLVEPLRRWQGPLLGICVGLQLLFDGSDEGTSPDGATPEGPPHEVSAGGRDDRCLGLVAGRVQRLEHAPLLPHIGWNDVDLGAHPLFTGVSNGTPFYFVHSYAPVPHDPAVVIGRTSYGTEFVAAIADGARLGVQFHPERSGSAGLQVLSNFVTVCREGRLAA